MPESWSDYRLEWRCPCGLEWHSPIRNGKFRFSCPECGNPIFEIEADTAPGNYQINLQPGAAAAVVKLSEAAP